jgi:hypothetical protein
MRFAPVNARFSAVVFFAIAFAVLPASMAMAAPILVKFDVTLSQPGPVVDSDAGIVVDNAATELDNLNGTNVGGVLFDPEFIDVTSTAALTTLAYMIQGGFDDHGTSGYGTAWPLGTAILFSNFVLDQPGTLASVSVTVDNVAGTPRVVGAGGGALVEGVDYLVSPNSLLLQLFGLGILEQPGLLPLGQMTFQLNFEAVDPPVRVPEPASSLMLFGMGMTALAARRRLFRRQ